MNTGPSSKKRRLHVSTETNNIEQQSIAIEEMPKQKHKQIKTAKFRLKTAGEAALLSMECNKRVPLMLTDIQHLLLHSLMGTLNVAIQPRWYVLENCGRIKQTTCLVLEGVSLQHWQKYKDKLDIVTKLFCDYFEILTPSVYNGSLIQELALVPLTEVEKEAIVQKYGSIDLALETRKDLMIMMKAVFPIQDDEQQEIDLKSEDKFPRTQLILSAWQLIDQNYPLPLKGKLQNAYSDYVMTKSEYKPVTAKSPMFGLDCEMCMTNFGSELTRVSVVNEAHEVVYESLVKPYNKITDYLTPYSGITKTLLDDVEKRLEHVQEDLRQLLPADAILVGHSLNTDLNALKMMHPYVIDTSTIYNFTSDRCRKPKLKILAKEFLQQDIQNSQQGHNPAEDALAALKLVQLKLKRSVEYGDAVHTSREKYKENARKIIQKSEYALSIFNHMLEQKKTSLVVGRDDITGDYHTYLSQAKESISALLKKNKSKKVKLNTVDETEDVITTLSTAVNEYNFAMGHLKLEVNCDDELKIMLEIDKWIETIWSNLQLSALFVVVLGGTRDENGVAMAAVKTDVCRQSK